MDNDRKKALVREWLETAQSGDADGALARMTDDPAFVIFNNALPGKEGIRGFCGMVTTLFTAPPTREFTAQYVDGDTVISQMTVRGNTKKNELYENYYVVIAHLVGDKIAKIQEYMDSAYAGAKFAP
jgi:ketosteroid isomerase-like protein